MIKIMPYEPGDAYRVKPRSIYGEDSELQYRTEQAATQERSISYKLVHDTDGIIAIVGGSEILPGNYEVWAITTDLLKKHKFRFSIMARELLVNVAKQKNIRRFQSTLMDNFVKGHRWFRFLGFELEGRLKKYGADGRDFFMYARVF